MKPRTILCFLVGLPSLWCTHLFLPVDQDATKHTPESIRECAKTCIKSTDDSKFCYGFTLDTNNHCDPNYKVEVPTSGSYFVLRDFHVSKECPTKGIATKTEAESYAKQLAEPKQRYFNGSLFVLVAGSRKIQECVDVCIEREAAMVYINSKEENEFVSDFCSKNVPEGLKYPCALGITTRKDEKTGKNPPGWKIDDKSQTPLTYNNYAIGEPASGTHPNDPVEECVGMYRLYPADGDPTWVSGLWNSLPCSFSPVQCLCRKEIKKAN